MTDWMDEALCRGQDPAPWFIDDLPSNARERHELEGIAKAICQRCPVRGSCLADALSTSTRNFDGTGIWGGFTPLERRKMRRNRTRRNPQGLPAGFPTKPSRGFPHYPQAFPQVVPLPPHRAVGEQ